MLMVCLKQASDDTQYVNTHSATPLISCDSDLGLLLLLTVKTLWCLNYHYLPLHLNENSLYASMQRM